jgi:hypothetical protein
MRGYRTVVVFVAIVAFSVLGHADNAAMVRKAVERSTLDQPGTKPFHLKADIAPTRDSDRASGRTGEVEIWWASQTQWRREVRSPEFHQIDIVNGGGEWQQNEGNYFPEWLREVAVALIDPVPSLDRVLEQIDRSEVRKVAGMTHFGWMIESTDGKVRKGMGDSLAITDTTGLLFYADTVLLRDFKSFHGRMIARTLTSGSPEVTVRVRTLEDLGETAPNFFDVKAQGGDPQLLRTVKVEETLLRKNLLSENPVTWPQLQDGPLEGVLTTEITVDRAGKVRQIETIVSDNPGVSKVAREAIGAMRFSPYLENGIPVQVVSRITMPFKTVRPPGVENFESARSYFERGRLASFPAAGNGSPYAMRAEFRARLRSGTVENGKYVDTWISNDRWRREAWIGISHYVRSKNGEKRYQLAEGPDAELLRAVFRVIEPIPALDTFVESDWRIKRDVVNGTNTIRVLTGDEASDGRLDAERARGYWFDDTGKVIKTYFKGIETRRGAFQDFRGVQVAHKIDGMYNDAPGIIVRVTDIVEAGSVADTSFDIRGHEWERAFTDEVR